MGDTDNSNSQQLMAMKRKRGRPRKDPTLKRIAVAPIPPGSNGATGGAIIGQAVTGVVDAAFGDGYILTVRIGNSDTILKGVVFKPGSYIPVTAENDIAPQVEMIKRHEVDMVTAHVSPTGSSPHLGGRGTLVPVVLQPVTVYGSSSANPETSVSRDKHVVTAEPLAMVLPERPPSSLSYCQFQTAPKNEELAPTAIMQNHASASNLAGVNDKEESEGVKQDNVATSVESMTVVQGSHSTLASHMNSPPYTPMSYKNYGTGRMSELLQAVQENVKPFVVHEMQNLK